MPNVSTMPTIFQIEIPSEFRDKFWDHPEDKLRFWAFKNRPHCFLEEKLLFTFDRRPVAEAKVLKMEDQANLNAMLQVSTRITGKCSGLLVHSSAINKKLVPLNGWSSLSWHK